MNQLLELWCQDGLPLKCTAQNYGSVVVPLQQQLNNIYETFTGDVEDFEEYEDYFESDLNEDEDDDYDDYDDRRSAIVSSASKNGSRPRSRFSYSKEDRRRDGAINKRTSRARPCGIFSP